MSAIARLRRDVLEERPTCERGNCQRPAVDIEPIRPGAPMQESTVDAICELHRTAPDRR
jgi:hypothetical protein